MKNINLLKSTPIILIAALAILELSTPKMNTVVNKFAENRMVIDEIKFYAEIIPAFCTDEGVILKNLLDENHESELSDEELEKAGYKVLENLKQNVRNAKPNNLFQKKIKRELEYYFARLISYHSDDKELPIRYFKSFPQVFKNILNRCDGKTHYEGIFLSIESDLDLYAIQEGYFWLKIILFKRRNFVRQVARKINEIALKNRNYRKNTKNGCNLIRELEYIIYTKMN